MDTNYIKFHFTNSAVSILIKKSVDPIEDNTVGMTFLNEWTFYAVKRLQ